MRANIPSRVLVSLVAAATLSYGATGCSNDPKQTPAEKAEEKRQEDIRKAEAAEEARAEDERRAEEEKQQSVIDGDGIAAELGDKDRIDLRNYETECVGTSLLIEFNTDNQQYSVGGIAIVPSTEAANCLLDDNPALSYEEAQIDAARRELAFGLVPKD